MSNVLTELYFTVVPAGRKDGNPRGSIYISPKVISSGGVLRNPCGGDLWAEDPALPFRSWAQLSAALRGNPSPVRFECSVDGTSWSHVGAAALKAADPANETFAGQFWEIVTTKRTSKVVPESRNAAVKGVSGIVGEVEPARTQSPNEALASDATAISTISSNEINAVFQQYLIDRASSPLDQPAALPWSARKRREMQLLLDSLTRIGTAESENPPASGEEFKDAPDLLGIISALSDDAALMRAIGLILDFEIPADAALQAARLFRARLDMTIWSSSPYTQMVVCGESVATRITPDFRPLPLASSPLDPSASFVEPRELDFVQWDSLAALRAMLREADDATDETKRRRQESGDSGRPILDLLSHGITCYPKNPASLLESIYNQGNNEPWYADDLVRGYVVDVIARRADGREIGPRNVCAREASYCEPGGDKVLFRSSEPACIAPAAASGVQPLSGWLMSQIEEAWALGKLKKRHERACGLYLLSTTRGQILVVDSVPPDVAIPNPDSIPVSAGAIGRLIKMRSDLGAGASSFGRYFDLSGSTVDEKYFVAVAAQIRESPDDFGLAGFLLSQLVSSGSSRFLISPGLPESSQRLGMVILNPPEPAFEGNSSRQFVQASGKLALAVDEPADLRIPGSDGQKTGSVRLLAREPNGADPNSFEFVPYIPDEPVHPLGIIRVPKQTRTFTLTKTQPEVLVAGSIFRAEITQDAQSNELKVTKLVETAPLDSAVFVGFFRNGVPLLEWDLNSDEPVDLIFRMDGGDRRVRAHPQEVRVHYRCEPQFSYGSEQDVWKFPGFSISGTLRDQAGRLIPDDLCKIEMERIEIPSRDGAKEPEIEWRLHSIHLQPPTGDTVVAWVEPDVNAASERYYVFKPLGGTPCTFSAEITPETLILSVPERGDSPPAFWTSPPSGVPILASLEKRKNKWVIKRAEIVNFLACQLAPISSHSVEVRFEGLPGAASFTAATEVDIFYELKRAGIENTTGVSFFASFEPGLDDKGQRKIKAVRCQLPPGAIRQVTDSKCPGVIIEGTKGESLLVQLVYVPPAAGSPGDDDNQVPNCAIVVSPGSYGSTVKPGQRLDLFTPENVAGDLAPLMIAWWRSGLPVQLDAMPAVLVDSSQPGQYAEMWRWESNAVIPASPSEEVVAEESAGTIRSTHISTGPDPCRRIIASRAGEAGTPAATIRLLLKGEAPLHEFPIKITTGSPLRAISPLLPDQLIMDDSIFQWKGGSLVLRDPGESSLDERENAPSVPKQSPFKMVVQRPSGLKFPPLRYGWSYRFRVRPYYLTGEIDEPGGIVDSSQWSRKIPFLRLEPLSAPPLLPESRADAEQTSGQPPFVIRSSWCSQNPGNGWKILMNPVGPFSVHYPPASIRLHELCGWFDQLAPGTSGGLIYDFINKNLVFSSGLNDWLYSGIDPDLAKIEVEIREYLGDAVIQTEMIAVPVPSILDHGRKKNPTRTPLSLDFWQETSPAGPREISMCLRKGTWVQILVGRNADCWLVVRARHSPEGLCRNFFGCVETAQPRTHALARSSRLRVRHVSNRPENPPELRELGIAERRAGATGLIIDADFVFDRASTGSVRLQAALAKAYEDDPSSSFPRVPVRDLRHILPEEHHWLIPGSPDEQAPASPGGDISVVEIGRRLGWSADERREIVVGEMTVSELVPHMPKVLVPEGGPAAKVRYIHDVGDRRHRTVYYRMLGVSRFEDFFTDHVCFSNPLPGDRSETWRRVEVPATQRPDPPIVTDTRPIFRWAADRDTNWARQGDGYHCQIRRVCGTRVWLARPWFSSGQDEKLAVLLPHNMRPRAAEAGAYLKTVSRWGSDPVFENELDQSLGNLTLERFLAADPASPQGIPVLAGGRTMGGLPMSQSSEGLADGSTPPVLVGLAVHEPKFHFTSQEWFVDIIVKVDRYTPFLWLTIARYQPYALKECSLSEPVSIPCQQILPERVLDVHVTPGDSLVVRCRLTGVFPPLENRVVRAKLQRFNRDMYPAATQSGLDPLGWEDVPSIAGLTEEPVEFFFAASPGNRNQWTGDFDIPLSELATRDATGAMWPHRLYVEECEVHPRAYLGPGGEKTLERQIFMAEVLLCCAELGPPDETRADPAPGSTTTITNNYYYTVENKPTVNNNTTNDYSTNVENSYHCCCPLHQQNGGKRRRLILPRGHPEKSLPPSER